MALIQGGNLPNVALPPLGGAPVITPAPVALPNMPIMVDMTIANATVATWMVLLTDYAMIADGGALSRPTNCIPASFTFPQPQPLRAGSRLQLSLGEVQALIKAGAAVYS
jgi:hypothetical protein